MTWPLAPRMADHVLNAPYYWDAYTNTMLMGARVNAALGRIDLYESYFFAPITNTIAFNENLFGLSLFFAPFYLASGNPLFAYNAVLLLSLALSAFFTYLLVRRVSGSALAGVLAGVAFAFCPYAMFESGRIQLVATQWIPLFFLFLHRALHTKRWPDVLGMGLAYALQVGTCLYYAMFMLPIAALLGGILLVRNRPFPRMFWAQLCGVGALTAGLIAFMVGPYFGTRKRFSLVRAEDFADNFDGKLSFLLNVYKHNKLLTFLHHEPITQQGAHEEIAFPTFTIAALGLLALLIRLYAMYQVRRVGDRKRLVLRLPLYALVVAAGATVATLFSHSFLSGAVVVWAGAFGWRWVAPGELPRSTALSDWLWALALTLALFLGLSPFEFRDEVVRGLYYYLHTGVPGFDGIRKVSRQAIMLMLCFSVLGGFGLASLLRALPGRISRAAVFCVLLGSLLLELRNAPFPLIAVPAGRAVSQAYRFIAAQPTTGAPIAVAPPGGGGGQGPFRGQSGLAKHNYLSLYHGRRTLNGKSSWIPSITHMSHEALRRLPSSTALRALQLLGPQYLVVHTGAMDPRWVPGVVQGLDQNTAMLRRVFDQGGDLVYEFLDTKDKSLGLLPTPEIDERVFALLRSKHIQVTTSTRSANAHKIIDGELRTRWSTHPRAQLPGDWVEFTFDKEREIGAIDLINHQKDALESPSAFKIQTSDDDGESWDTVFRRPRLRLYADQVHHPNRFVFRVVLPKPVRTQRLRIKLLEEMPGKLWAINEARLWTPIKSTNE